MEILNKNPKHPKIIRKICFISTINILSDNMEENHYLQIEKKGV